MNQEFLEFDNSEAWVFMVCSNFQLKNLKRQNSSWSCIVYRNFSWDLAISTILVELLKLNNFDEDLSFRTDNINRLNSFLLTDFPERVHVYKMTFRNFQIAYFLLQNSCH